ncbi:MAG TPA: glycosyltransferase family 39 protein, partial [Tepidisphaeraceae bacterium]|nr:glycosyltransferase family 39 protein [Tepidisphaeraceae bacterium]
MASVGAPWNGASVEVPTVALVRTEGVLRLAARPGSPPMHVNPWFVPVINDQVRLQKPPLPYWCAAAFFRFFSTNEAWGRLVPALLGFASTFLIMSIARRTYGESSELWAGLIWATTFFVIDEHRKSMADPYLAFATLLCVWAWVRAIREPRGSRWVLAMFYAGLGVGFLAKGPVIFLHVAFAVGAFTLSRRKLRPLIPGGWIAHVIGVLILLVLIVPWPLYVLMKIPNAPELWRYESIGEISDNTQKARAWWQYFPSLLQITLPWTPLMLIGIVSAARRRHRWFPLAWLAAAILFFSLLHAKKNAYLLPVM